MNVFLLLAAVAVAIVAAAAAAARWRIAHTGARAASAYRDLGCYELGYLAGGPGRAAETVIAHLVSTGAARLSSGGRVHKVKASRTAGDPVEEAVAGVVARRSGLTVAALKAEVARSVAVGELGKNLAQEGLLLADRPRAWLRGWTRLLLWAGVAALAGFVVTLVSLFGGPGTYGLIALLVFGGTAVAAGIALRGHRRYMRAPLTPSGRAALAAARRADDARDEPVSIALNGVNAVRDTRLRVELRRTPPRPRRVSSGRRAGGFARSRYQGAGYGVVPYSVTSMPGRGACGGGSSSCGGGGGCGGGGCGGGGG
ncbi:TIGR04222 domain-containing membrane protein [Nonomuraea sp. NPDC049309]|uniref:TIGR04222 domain-containing membrane protein n=1 Tax=Nonomuraea sp. NPDC049309 TaxID=3364350 RepID=UPI0037172F75